MTNKPNIIFGEIKALNEIISIKSIKHLIVYQVLIFSIFNISKRY